MKTEIYKPLKKYISSLNETELAGDRITKLLSLVEYIQFNKNEGTSLKLNFICTHNSRRSHLCQVWAKVMAAYYGIDKVKCYSGGTESTAVYKTVVEVLISTGFEVTSIAHYENPTYKVNFTEENCPMTLFSKRYNDRYNPRENYAAVMTCNDADANCPIIPAVTRISLPYVDPKVSDGTAEELEIYSERSRQIATEMKYIFSQIK
tara:strand:+ start:22 stop:639 length:618 start_codon:yes stop_codon:yes gene_type:complete